MIDRYLAELRRTLAPHRDVDDLLDEVADHLHSSAERGRAAGLDPEAADRRALDAFGDPDLVARVYAAERRGGLAVPTRFTRTAGTLLVLGGAAWTLSFVLLLGVAVLNRTNPLGVPSTLYLMSGSALAIGATAMIPGLVGVYVRHRRRGPLLLAAFVLLGVGLLACGYPMALIVWVPSVGSGAALLAVWLRRHDMAPRNAALQLGVGGAAATVVVLTPGVGVTADAAWLLALVAALMVCVVGIVGLGRWLRSEQPLDDPEQALVA